LINNISKNLIQLNTHIKNSKRGLPEEIFIFISKTTPLVNVDLLIKDKYHGVLLTWRDDRIYGKGWHIPGGIVRFKESFAERINKVAEEELGSKVVFSEVPLFIKENIHPTRNVRGHFISILFSCQLLTKPYDILKYKGGMPKKNQWQWHSKCPPNILPVHKYYGPFINK